MDSIEIWPEPINQIFTFHTHIQRLLTVDIEYLVILICEMISYYFHSKQWVKVMPHPELG